jgi:hypothetical protein
MGWLSDLLQGVPLNAVLRERVALAEQKFRDMETENTKLREELAAARKEFEEIKRQIADAPVAVAPPMEQPKIENGIYFFGHDGKPYCPRCYEVGRKKCVMRLSASLGYLCPVCDKIIPL